MHWILSSNHDGFSLTCWEENYRGESRIFLKTILDLSPRKKEKLKGINTFFFICVAFRISSGVLRKLTAFSTSNFNFTWKKRFFCHLSSVTNYYLFLAWAILNNILKYFCIFFLSCFSSQFCCRFFRNLRALSLYLKTLSIVQSNLI